MSVAGTMAVRTLVLIEQFEIRDNSITHKPTGSARSIFPEHSRNRSASRHNDI
jgi:hypothetical protein